MPDRMCRVEYCASSAVAKDLCSKHYRRQHKHGDPGYVTPRTGEHNNCYRGDAIGIGAAHYRVIQQKGPASGQACCSCGGQAAHWAYDHRDPEEKQSPTLPGRGNPGPYSTRPEHYQPMCVPCHKRFDLEYIRNGASCGMART